MLYNWGCITYVKSRAMALNLVEYKSPVQNVIAYARIACLLCYTCTSSYMLYCRNISRYWSCARKQLIFLYNLGFTIESGGSLTNACKGFLALLRSVSIVTLYFFMFVCICVCIDQIGNKAINQSHCYAFPK